MWVQAVAVDWQTVAFYTRTLLCVFLQALHLGAGEMATLDLAGCSELSGLSWPALLQPATPWQVITILPKEHLPGKLLALIGPKLICGAKMTAGDANYWALVLGWLPKAAG